MLCSCAYYKLQNTQTLEPTKVTEFYVRKKKIISHFKLITKYIGTSFSLSNFQIKDLCT